MSFFCCNLNHSVNDELQNKENRRIEKMLKSEKQRLRGQINILLLGTGESGKSTIMKQMKIIHGENLMKNQSLDECRHLVYLNILKGMKVLIDARSKLEIPWKIDSDSDSELTRKADMVFRSDTKNQITLEYFSRYVSLIDQLWKNSAIQTTFESRNQFQLSDGLAYLLKNLKRISSDRYVPTNQDLLHTRTPTRTVLEYSVVFKGVSLCFIDVGGQRKQRKKWLQCFDSITSIMFVVSSIEYDQFLVEDNNTNRLVETLEIFELIIDSIFFRTESVILFLNKTDLLIEKLKNLKHRSNNNNDFTKSQNKLGSQFLKDFFPEFGGDSTDVGQVQNFLFKSFDQRKKRKNLYNHFTTAVDTENIKHVFNDVRNTILQENIKSVML